MHRAGVLYLILLVSEIMSIAVLTTQYRLILSDPSSNSIAWYKTWGGQNRDYSYDAVFAGGALYVTGASFSYGPGLNNLILLKYSQAGDLVWNETYSLGGYTMGRGTASDGTSIYVCGIHLTTENSSYSLLLKYDLDGRLIWEKEWRPGQDARSTGVTIDIAGNIYVTGYVTASSTTNNEFLLKYNRDGDLLLSMTVPSKDTETAWSISVSDAVYICGEVGYNTSNPLPTTKMLLTKLSLDGKVIWSRESSTGVENAANCVDAKQEISVAGYTLFTNGTAKEVLRQYSSDGALRNTLILGESPIEDMAWGIATAGPYMYVVGHARPNFNDMADASVCKLSPDGKLIWRDYYGDTNIDRARAVTISGDDVYVVGETYQHGLDMQVSVKKYVSPNAALSPEVSGFLKLLPILIGCLLLLVEVYDRFPKKSTVLNRKSNRITEHVYPKPEHIEF